MIKPKFITFTGIDERTDPDEINRLSSRYPVEWGILFSKSNQGQANRYPPLHVATRILERCEGAKFSAHICGRYSNQIMTARDVTDHVPWELTDLAEILMGYFDRTQINIADGETLVHEKDVRPQLAKNWAEIIGAAGGAIVQCRRDFPNDPSVAWLYDRSGGAGRLQVNWSANAAGSSAFCGYAGGIGPETVRSVLDAIEQAHPADKPFWIDMEGNVRTNDWLDLNKCEAVLRAVYG